MRIAICSDHAGFDLKTTLIEYIEELAHDVIDFGTDSDKSVDYPDFVEPLGNAIKAGNADRGIVVCGSGIGGCITANKMNGIYGSICHDVYSARQRVEHDDMNVLCLGSRVVDEELAKLLVNSFLDARFVGNDPGGERHLRRTNKMKNIEKKGLSR